MMFILCTQYKWIKTCNIGTKGTSLLPSIHPITTLVGHECNKINIHEHTSNLCLNSSINKIVSWCNVTYVH